MNEADELSDRVGIMNRGKLVALDSPHKLKEQYGKEEVFIEYKDSNEEILKTTMPLNTHETATFLYEKMDTGSIINIHSQEATFADVFATLTESELS